MSPKRVIWIKSAYKWLYKYKVAAWTHKRYSSRLNKRIDFDQKRLYISNSTLTEDKSDCLWTHFQKKMRRNRVQCYSLLNKPD